MALITLEQAKVHLKLDDTTGDDMLNHIIPKAIEIVSTYCQRPFDSTSYKQLYNGDGDRVLMLDNAPIISVQLVSEDLDLENKKYDSVLAEYADYLINKRTGKLEKIGSNFIAGQRNIYVSYTANYVTNTYPKDLQFVALDLTAKKYKDFMDGRYGIITKNVMGDNVSFTFEDFSEMHKELMEQHILYGEINGIDVDAFSAES